MKNEIGFIIVILLISNTLNSHIITGKVNPDLKHHSVYLEIGGSSLFYSLNYDYTLRITNELNLAVGSGFAYSPRSIADYQGYAFVIAPACNLLLGKSSHHVETGLALLSFGPVESTTLSARIGYRYQRPSGGFLFRIGDTPILMGGPEWIMPWAGVSFGYTF